ncbi:E3 ubiquitin-protein ligase rnf213-alpha isoform X2 [Hydra vulgaris]|uniref:E3 ubiquitin-protein ligase rnf213-alpha isoform X2 n=1 Tax=Hydra vulgaris TaxID=6087 RepID=UPI001F5F11A3|nr:E3 ubiquitin-protein ligase rnf213-alpha isoform X2 [Hydra vulgaris]
MEGEKNQRSNKKLNLCKKCKKLKKGKFCNKCGSSLEEIKNHDGESLSNTVADTDVKKDGISAPEQKSCTEINNSGLDVVRNEENQSLPKNTNQMNGEYSSCSVDGSESFDGISVSEQKMCIDLISSGLDVVRSEENQTLSQNHNLKNDENNNSTVDRIENSDVSEQKSCMEVNNSGLDVVKSKENQSLPKNRNLMNDEINNSLADTSESPDGISVPEQKSCAEVKNSGLDVVKSEENQSLSKNNIIMNDGKNSSSDDRLETSDGISAFEQKTCIEVNTSGLDFVRSEENQTLPQNHNLKNDENNNSIVDRMENSDGISVPEQKPCMEVSNSGLDEVKNKENQNLSKNSNPKNDENISFSDNRSESSSDLLHNKDNLSIEHKSEIEAVKNEMKNKTVSLDNSKNNISEVTQMCISPQDNNYKEEHKNELPSEGSSSCDRSFGNKDNDQLAQHNLSFGGKKVDTQCSESRSSSCLNKKDTDVNKPTKTTMELRSTNKQKSDDTGSTHKASYADQAKKNLSNQEGVVKYTVWNSIIYIKFFYILQKRVENLGISFGNDCLGGWKGVGVKMIPLSNDSEGVIYTGDLKINKECIQTPLEYKYVIQGKQKTWEFLHLAGSLINSNRVLKVSLDDIELGLIYQVDDCFLHENRENNLGFISWVKSKILGNDDRFTLFQVLFKRYLNLLNNNPDMDIVHKTMFIRGLYSGFYDAYTAKNGDLSLWLKLDNHFEPLRELLVYLEGQVKKDSYNDIETISSNLSLLVIFYKNDHLIKQINMNFLCSAFNNLSLENKNYDCDSLSTMLKEFFSPKYLSMIKKSLESLLEYWFSKSDFINNDMVHVWCYAVVMVHILSEENKNYLKLQDFDKSNCGLPAYFIKMQKRKLILETFNNLNKIQISLKKDRLLQRGLVYLMEPQCFHYALNTGYFNERLLINMITFRLSSANQKELNEFQNFLNGLMTNIPKEEKKRAHVVEAMFNMLLKVFEKIKLANYSFSFVSIILNCIETFTKSIDQKDTLLALHKETSKTLSTIKSILPDYFVKWDDKEIIPTQLKLMQILSRFQVNGKRYFQEDLVNILQSKLRQTDNMLLFKFYCELDIKLYDEEIASELSRYFFLTIDALINQADFLNLLPSVSQNYCTTLLTKYISNKWCDLQSTEDKLNFCLDWQPFKVFLQVIKNVTNEDAAQVINDYISVMQNLCKNIEDGNIRISLFSYLSKKKITLFELTKVFGFDTCENIETYFAARVTQMNVFNRVCDTVKYTLQMFKQVFPNIEMNKVVLEEKLQLSDILLKDVFKEMLNNDQFNEEESEEEKIIYIHENDRVSYEKQADEEINDCDVANKELSENVSNSDADNNELSDEEVSDNDVSNEELGDEEVSDNNVNNEELGDEEVSDNDVSNEESSDEDVSDNEISNEELSDEDVSDNDISNKESNDEDLSDKEVVNEELSYEYIDQNLADKELSDRDVTDDYIIEKEQVNYDIYHSILSHSKPSMASKKKSYNEILVDKACDFFTVSRFWFNYSSEVMNHNLASNLLFQKKLEFFLMSYSNSTFDLHSDLLIRLVYIPINEDLTAYVQSVLSCKISLSDLSTVIPNYKVEVYTEELKNISEYLHLNFSRDKFDRSMAKIKSVFLMKKYYDVASNAFQVKEQLKLKGDFSALQCIMRPVNEFEELEDVTSCENNEFLFQTLTPTINEIFKSISSCMLFFTWISDNLKTPKEVKVFVEIMSTAAGETDYDVDRVKCFEACCLAFNDVIFNLNNKSGFKELLQTCQQIEEKMKNDPNIIKKLIDTNNNIEWFINAQKSQGSVATKTIMEAQTANRNGCFIIGNHGNNNGDFIVTKLSDVVKFEIRNSTEKVYTPKTYTLEEVNDLQSRLMLLGGDIGGTSSLDQQKEKDYFIEVVEVIMRLGHAYMMLCDAGDVNYINWKKTFLCNIESDKENLLADLRIETEKIEKKLTEWNNILKSIRSVNPVINHFTVRQCLFLQKHLYLLSKDSKYCNKLPSQFYSLLKFFGHDVTSSNIKNAFSLSHSLLGKNQSTKDDWKKVKSQSNFEEMTAIEIQNIVNLLQDEYDISETVAWAAILNVFPYREGKAILWCNKQSPDDDQIIEFELEARKRYEQLVNLNNCDEVLSGNGNIIENETYISLEELGCFFKEYIEIIKFQQAKRIIPKYINKDKPSLFILPRDEILYALLNIYLYDSGSFPSSEEVLLCDNSVSIEEIELLILRAYHNKDGLYCLVIDDSLQYEVCEKAYNFLQETMKLENMSPLIVFCSSESQNESYFATALENYKIKIPICIKRENICKKILDGLEKKLVDKNIGIHLNGSIYKALVVQSKKSGMGKSFCVEKCGDQLSIQLDSYYQRMPMVEKKASMVTIPVHGTTVNVNSIVEALLEFDEIPNLRFPRLYHFDINPMVKEGLDSFLFNLVILGSLKTSTGKLWRMNDNDTCIIEITIDHTEGHLHSDTSKSPEGVVINMLPFVTCLSPCEVLKSLSDQTTLTQDLWYDTKEYLKSSTQRVCQYLNIYDGKIVQPQISQHRTPNSSEHRTVLSPSRRAISPIKKEVSRRYLSEAYIHQTLDNFVYNSSQPNMTLSDCLQILLKYCGVRDPCWSELRNFVHFFNSQLIDCENSVFTSAVCANDLRGFKHFVVKFLLEMSQDFSTHSLSYDTLVNNPFMVQLKRHWEHSLHPYLFFNQDHATMTFFGFNIDYRGNLFDPETRLIIKENIMSPELYNDINRQMAGCLNTNYNDLKRKQKLELICRVLGVPTFDPDPTYELTVDNLKKILAIHMRLRCIIPVIMMGETGCGKTKLIKFMSALQAGSPNIRNMLLVKVHGGVTHQDILMRIEQAKRLAKKNFDNYMINTILFFDEANTSDAIGLIKEIMVDKRADGKPLGLAECGLEIIAACNPYRKHTRTMIEKLESAGLGYHVKSPYEKIGDIPLRQLVYRVHPLPKSMVPLVWDFGQLNPETEKTYARQIIMRYIKQKALPDEPIFFKLIINVLAESQVYMRKKEDECHFVSLRDVERVLMATSWFYRKINILLHNMDSNISDMSEVEKMCLSLIYALHVCYIAKLEDRDSYRKNISKYFKASGFACDANRIKEEVYRLQKSFLKGIDLEENIAQNEALCENVFMMVICIELRIPLFVVGKPGSSKSLAKSIVQDSMQGKMSKSVLFKEFKQIFMLSYQCSPLSTAERIINTFRQCSRFQVEKDLDTFASVVVLDEVGLAEDSPRMPLKALHSLLEDGTDGSEDLTADGSEFKDKRVAFIGISNWSLDPAKMNRGIMLYRGQPSVDELVLTARDICSGDKVICGKIAMLFEPLTKGYFKVYEEQNECKVLINCKKEEFFGLRDFYSLIKLVFCYARKLKDSPSISDIKYAVKRNFSGLQEVNTWKIFKSFLPQNLSKAERTFDVLSMIKDSIADQCPCYVVRGKNAKRHCLSSRYLLLMTEDFSALPIIDSLYEKEKYKSCIIFGSSFPKDQEFTQVCRDINRIKICMETGTKVVLLNMENLYESLYDALNQYYVSLGGENYVDLGIGTHRVKCRVHEGFRLIVIADRANVYNTFPIPLINRLEKHFLTLSNGMPPDKLKVVEKLKEWATHFSCVKSTTHEFRPSDSFIGYTEDTCASIVLKLSKIYNDSVEIFEEGCKLLLKLATPDSLSRVMKSPLKNQFGFIQKIFYEQFHSSLISFLYAELGNEDSKFMQVTTFSKLLSPIQKESLTLELIGFKVEMASLMQFETERLFREFIRVSFNSADSNERTLIIIQVNNAQERKKLIACAQYICKEMREQFKVKKISILFILQLNYKSNCLNLLSSLSFWDCSHIDELCCSNMPSFIKHTGKSLYDIFCNVDGEEKSKLIGLIIGSIQMTTRQISERKKLSVDEVSERINKITALLKSQPQDMEYLFVTTIMELIQSNLKKEENNILPDYINNWVQYEAVEQKYIKNYGTFQQALCYYVEDRIVPILSSIISNIDSFGNLSILFKQPSYTDLWLNIFSKTNCSSIQVYNESEVSFQCKFPFSNRLCHEIELVIKNVVQPDDNFNKHDYKLIYDTLSSLPMASLTLGLSKSNVDDYIYDLVRLLFPYQTERSYEVLAFGLVFFGKNVVTARSKFFSSLKTVGDLDNSIYDITAIHIVLNTRVIQERIGNMALILRNHPEISDMISLNSPIDIDILILEKLVSIVNRLEMSPFSMNKIKHLHFLIQNILDIKFEGCGSLTTRKISEIRVQWCKLRICERFSEFVFHPSSCFCSHQTGLLHLFKKSLDKLDDDMLTKDSWATVENFLKEDAINFCSDFNDNLIYRDLNKCMTCDGISDGKDIEILLPCCKRNFTLCIHRILFKTNKCPSCNEVFEKEVIFKESLQRRHMIFEREEFKKRCNSFYAEVVTEFYFARRNFNLIESDVSKKILEFVFSAPATSNLLSDISNVDSTSIICSYLLQQLIQRSYNDVESYLQEHIQRLFDNENKSQLLSAATFFVYCFEDKLQLEHFVLKKNSIINASFLDAVSEGLHDIHDLEEKFTLDSSNTNPKFLESIASARLFLGYSADILYSWFAKENKDMQLKKNFNSFFATLGKFLIKYKNTSMHIYVLKQIVRKNGVESLKKILMEVDADWLVFEEKENYIESYDKLLIYGENYKNLYNSLVTKVLEDDQSGLSQLETDIEKTNSETMLWLAIPKAIQNLHKFHDNIISRVQHRSQIQICQSLLNNFKSYEQFSDILYHFWVVVNSGRPAVELFSLLVMDPQKVKNWFFPAMPSDTFAEVFDLNKTDKFSSFAFYTCPQGHPYAITECGRPWVTDKCPTCFLPIGGKSHRPVDGNQAVASRNDSTKPGHCLGLSSERSTFSIPQRGLTPASATLQTLLINLSLFISTLLGNEKEVSELVYPRVSTLQLKTFFLAHLEKDFVLLSNIIAKNDDETNTVLHLLFKYLLDCDLQDQLLELRDKASRNQFENTFHQAVVQPFFCTLNDQFESYNKCLLTDQCITNSPLMRHIYEIDDKDNNKDSSMTLKNPQLWFYRQSVSIESLKNFVQLKINAGAAKDIPILLMILEQESILNAIKDLSSILELQIFLQHEFNYKLDKQTAVDKNVKQFLTEFPKENQGLLQKLFKCFIKAWNESRVHFTARQMKLDHNLHSIKLDLNSKLAYFISSSSDHGLCAAMLMDFLAFKQNELLLECQLINSIHVFQQVHISKLKKNDIISYERERDLLPLVYKHCEYSLDVVGSPKIEYNLDAIQKHLFEKVIFGKSIINIEIIQFLFRDGLKSLNFPSLRSNVKQTDVPYSEQQSMLEEFNNITDISKALRAVETAIGILAYTGGDPNMFYRKYLQDILRMDECEYLSNGKMQNFIRLTHLHSVWLMLTRERACRIYTSKQQVPFQINEFFMVEDLDDQVIEKQKKKFRQFDTIEILSLVTEYIVLELPLRKELDATMMLAEAFQIYGYGSSAVDQINEEFQLKHIYMFWKMVASLV